MAVTALPGPFDALTEGILAGAKVASLAAALKQQRIENQLSSDQLMLGMRRMALEEQLAPAMTESRLADASFNRARENQLSQLLAAGSAQAEVEGTKAQTGEAQARTGEAQARTKGLDQAQLLQLVEGATSGVGELTPAQSSTLATSIATARGAPTDPNTISLYDQLVRAEHDETREKLSIARAQADSMAVYRSLMGLAAEERAEKTPNIQDKARFEALTKELEVIDASQAQADLIEESRIATGTPISPVDAASLNAINARRKARKAEIDAQLAPAKRTLKIDPDTGLPIVNDDEDFKALMADNSIPSGSVFIDPEGFPRQKP